MSKIRQLYAERPFVLSFECFPPKTEKGHTRLVERILPKLAELSPDFMTVTCGAMGGTRDHTVEIAAHITRELGVPSMAHTTCVWADRDQIRATLDRTRDAGIDGVMALRGDAPKDEPFVAPEGGFAHASELVELIRAEGHELTVGVAGYPEVHPESSSRDDDLRWLAHKVARGADFVATQVFFDNDPFLEFATAARDAGVAVPIVPGILPISNYGKIVEFCSFCGTTLPDELRAIMEPIADDPKAVREAGAQWAANQVRDLMGAGIPGVHVYVLNQTRSVRRMLELLDLER